MRGGGGVCTAGCLEFHPWWAGPPGCDSCLEACWLGLDPRVAFKDPDCDGCGRCVPVCPNTRLGIGLHRPRWWKGTPAIGVGVVVLLAACAVPAPRIVSGTAPWSSPFMPPAEPEGEADVCFTAHDVDDRALEVGVARVSAEEIALRVYLEETPGTPWRGPLTVVVEGSGGADRVVFEGPSAPRSVPRPSLYEARILTTERLRWTLENGPLAGTSGALCRPTQSAPTPRWALLPGALVLGLFGAVKLRRGRLRGRDRLRTV